MGKCNHKWIDMEDGSLDKFCVRCSEKAKQAVMFQPTINISINSDQISVENIVDKINNELIKKLKFQC